jgi:hypothetical protein
MGRMRKPPRGYLLIEITADSPLVLLEDGRAAIAIEIRAIGDIAVMWAESPLGTRATARYRLRWLAEGLKLLVEGPRDR